MASRVINPVALAEFSKLHTPARSSIGRNLSCGRQLNSARKNLFGKADPADTIKTLNELLEKHQEKASKKWNFDFRKGCPMHKTNTKFTWQRVAPCTDFIPQMCTLSRAAHVRETPEVTIFDRLLDERADRENFSSSNAEDDSCDDSQDESLVMFKAPAESAAPSTVVAASRTLPKRQPRITEYMKERKRLAQAPKKISPSKRARTTTSSNTSPLINTLIRFKRNH